MKTNNTLIWPVDGECNYGCLYYVEGSLKKVYAGEKGLVLGFHCRFDGFKGEGVCGANALNQEVTEERVKKAAEEEDE